MQPRLRGNWRMQIEYLADHPQFAPLLAAWHHAEWASLMPEWSREQAESELRSHTARRQIPTTLVALDAGELLGSVSLVVSDLPGWEHLSPWLASAYVILERRGTGIGTALTRRAMLEARELGVPKLHLFTAGQKAFYERLGWKSLVETHHAGHEVVIMHCDLRQP